MKKLIAYYSRADENYFGGQRRYITEGNTEKAAKMLAELTGADLFQIEQKVPYAADYDTCIAQAKKDLQAGARPELVTLPDSLDEYDEIYLGYPNYWGTMPAPVFSFLEQSDLSGKEIWPFCTHEDGGFGHSLEDLKRVCPASVIADGLSIRGAEVQNETEAMEHWVTM